MPLTLYFLGSGYGYEAKTDNMVIAYDQTEGPKALFPGPGGKDPKIYCQDVAKDEELTWTTSNGWGSAKKRSVTGKGWNRAVGHAISIIADEIASGEQQINFVGHSRGSISILMLLNDLFYQYVPRRNNYKINLGARKIGRSSSRFKSNDLQGEELEEAFSDWYLKQLREIWRRRISGDVADRMIAKLVKFQEHKDSITEINAFLFDPVGGLTGADSDRQRCLASHRSIKRVRVARMESGGLGLSSNMPLFPQFALLDGRAMARNLALVTEGSERFKIPIPGSHGAAIDDNGGATIHQKAVGMYLMTKFLRGCGTEFADGFDSETEDEVLEHYDALFEEFDGTQLASATPFGMGGNTPRKNQLLGMKDASGHYRTPWINAHHKFLAGRRTFNPLVGNE